MPADHRLQQRQRLLADERVRKLIRNTAYQFYLERGGGHGKDQEDWARAEEDVISLLQELIVIESQIQVPRKSKADLRTIAPTPRRPSKSSPQISPFKKKSGMTPRIKQKGTPKKKRDVAPPSGGPPLLTV